MTEPSTIAVLLAIALSWGATVFYSRWRFPWLACASCGGSGKVFEPFVMRLACLRVRKRAWRDCGTCDGASKRPRTKKAT